MSLRGLRETLASALRRFEAVGMSERELDSLEFQTAMNLLKVNASEMATSTVRGFSTPCDPDAAFHSASRRDQ